MRMIKCGWQNADGKLPMTLCRWSNPYEEKLTYDVSWNWVLFVNKPSHLIEVRSKHFKTGAPSPKKPDKPWSNSKRLDLYRPTPFFLHYIEEGLLLSTTKQISNVEKRRYGRFLIEISNFLPEKILNTTGKKDTRPQLHLESTGQATLCS